MRINYILISALLLMTTACNRNSNPETHSANSCPELKQLFVQMERLENSFTKEPFELDGTSLLLDSIEKELHANLNSGKSECSFLNQQAHPAEVRFDFVDPMATRIISNELPSGIERIKKLRDLFASDKEVSEYFGEVLARIAEKGPLLYIEYCKIHPEEQESLLKSTRWSMTDKHKLADTFAKIEGGKSLSDFLHSN